MSSQLNTLVFYVSIQTTLSFTKNAKINFIINRVETISWI